MTLLLLLLLPPLPLLRPCRADLTDPVPLPSVDDYALTKVWRALDVLGCAMRVLSSVSSTIHAASIAARVQVIEFLMGHKRDPVRRIERVRRVMQCGVVWWRRCLCVDVVRAVLRHCSALTLHHCADVSRILLHYTAVMFAVPACRCLAAQPLRSSNLTESGVPEWAEAYIRGIEYSQLLDVIEAATSMRIRMYDAAFLAVHAL